LRTQIGRNPDRAEGRGGGTVRLVKRPTWGPDKEGYGRLPSRAKWE